MLPHGKGNQRQDVNALIHHKGGKVCRGKAGLDPIRDAVDRRKDQHRPRPLAQRGLRSDQNDQRMKQDRLWLGLVLGHPVRLKHEIGHGMRKQKRDECLDHWTVSLASGAACGCGDAGESPCDSRVCRLCEIAGHPADFSD